LTDLKPDNIMLVPDVEMPGSERVKILDFGIAEVAIFVLDEKPNRREPIGSRAERLAG
jgi:serine/threonine protein kinase